MKKKILKHDQFYIWVFEMDKNEGKDLPSDELTRKLNFPRKLINELLSSESPIPEPRHWNFKNFTHPLNAISIFVKGSFVVVRGDNDPFIAKAGEGAYRYIYSKTTKNVHIKALEDNSEYHCILPRDHTARYWWRKLHKKTTELDIFEEHYIYLASGKIDINDNVISGPNVINISGVKPFINVLEPSIFVEMWIDD